MFEPIDDETEALAHEIVDAVSKVYIGLGPGLLESVYERCLYHELLKRAIPCQRQVAVPVQYDDTTIEGGLRIDILVAGRIVIELKAVDELKPVHHSQILTYLKLTGHRLGFLINFNVARLKQGIKRFIL
ncbi:MAG: GxxExxY protein [Bacteroidetes bacterium]|nr:MAG: GxxExxY protein [Bacteroidota bacterium]